MKVEVRVISGTNFGKVFDLTKTAEIGQDYVLCEDDVLEFYAYTKQEYSNIHLALHEIVLPPNNPLGSYDHVTNQYTYYWQPTSRYYSFFHNFCGLAELLIVEKIDLEIDNFEIKLLKELQPIEVLARKINAERITIMLDFLARDDCSDLAALARITRRFSGIREGEKNLSYTLDQVESYIQLLKQSLKPISQHPICKLVPKHVYKSYTPELNISEDSINYLLENLDQVYEVSSDNDVVFELDGSFYSVDKIMEVQYSKDTNLYENQVIHGFIDILILSLKKILNRLQQNTKKTNNSKLEGYESLFSKLKDFDLKLNGASIERCRLFIHHLNKLRADFNQCIPVKVVNLREPVLTHKAKNHPIYRMLFQKMIEWLRFGQPDWSLQDQLNSIQDLPKLFEFYIFCLVKQHVLNFALQYNGKVIASPLIGGSDNSFIIQINKNVFAELFYEPNIYVKNPLDTTSLKVLTEYRNTEAWKVERGILKQHRDSAKDPLLYRRMPDVVLKIYNNSNESLLIMDAKYMDSRKAFAEALPECTMKYIHGIHHQNGENKTIGLMLLNPDQKDFSRHFHHESYSIYGENPVIPALLTTSLDLKKGDKLNGEVQRNIFKFIELMLDRIEPNGLGAVNVALEHIYNQEEAKLGLENSNFSEFEIKPTVITKKMSQNSSSKSYRKKISPLPISFPSDLPTDSQGQAERGAYWASFRKKK